MEKSHRTGIWMAAIIGLLLLQAGGPARAFTIIEIENSIESPGNTITTPTTFNAQVQPLINTLNSHLRVSQRKRNPGSSAQQGNIFASNSYTDTLTDVGFIEVSSHGGSKRGIPSLWFGTTFTEFENDFSRTEHDGNAQLLLFGFDYTKSDRYIVGVSLSYETSRITTDFNLGDQDIDGYSINPYFAWLISDAWSVDLSLGLGSFDTEQTRAIGQLDTGPPIVIDAAAVNSDFSTDRDFVSTNLTYSVPRGNWYLTGWLGLISATQDQDAYTESDDTRVESEELDFKRWSIGGEAAYAHRIGETYLGLIYDKDEDVNEIEFDSGEQPENDDDSWLVTLGWRYFGGDVVASIELSSRQGADDASENSITSSLRIDL